MNARLERRRAELELMSGQPSEAEPADDPTPSAASGRTPRVTAEVLAVYDLLADWRSIADLAEKLGPSVSQASVKKIVRLLDDQGLLRSVESWPARYRLRFHGELSEAAKTFRARVEDARSDD